MMPMMVPTILLFLLWTLSDVNPQLLLHFDDIEDSGGWPGDIFNNADSNHYCHREAVASGIKKNESNYESYCDCYETRQVEIYWETLTCAGVDLEADEQVDIYPKDDIFSIIRFQNSIIPVVSVGAFRAYTNATKLYLNQSYVESIHPGAFTGLTNLHELYLQNNHINEVSKGIFNSLPNLEILILSNNNIQVIEEHTFLGLFSIQRINLATNKLKHLRGDTFQKLNTLNILDLSNNLLSNLPADLFYQTNSLQDLKLSYNNLTHVTFSLLPHSLAYLRLDHNNITNLTDFPSLSNLREIDLGSNNIINTSFLPLSLTKLIISNNKIEMIDDSLFNNTKELRTIDLSHNLLTNLSEDVFSNLSQLTNLYLQNNQLDNIPIGCFQNLGNLIVLDLSSNLIEELEYGTFAGLHHLKHLEISSNRLSYIYESSLHSLKNLYSLDISNNQISSFDPHVLLQYLRGLTIVFLDNNPWNCKSLLKIVHEFEQLNIEIMEGSVVKTENVHGIACINNKYDNYFSVFKENDSLEHFDNLSNELNSLKDFFRTDFQKSNFYKFFENFRNLTFQNNVNTFDSEGEVLRLFNKDFENTTFFKLLNKNLTEINNVDSFQNVLLNISKELRLLNFNAKNLDLPIATSFNTTQTLSDYFENDFKNSSFYNYFNKAFIDSKFNKFFTEIIPSKIESALLRVQNYLDLDIQNSSFYKLFNRNNWNELNTNLLSSNSDSHFSHLTSDSNTNNAELLTKISELTDNIKIQQGIMQSSKIGTTVLMIIVIILLVAITSMFAFNHIKPGMKQKMGREKHAESKVNITDAEMEML